MKKQLRLTQAEFDRFAKRLLQQEHAPATIQCYLRHLRSLAAWLGGRALDKQALAGWKSALAARGYRPASINTMLAAANCFAACMGCAQYKVRYLRVQRQLFRGEGRDLSRQDLFKLVRTARAGGNERLALLAETLAGTGVRVSELAYITVEAARAGSVDIALKGKIRTILLPGKLCRRLLRYAKQNGIAAGAVFVARSGRALSRKWVWAALKRLGAEAGVAAAKVFPHNFRHLFACTFYSVSRDVVKLADVLGHSSVETTRVYLIATRQECMAQLNRLRLVV